MGFLKSQRGFSLIEAIVGMVLLAILVGAVLSVTMGDKKMFSNRVSGNMSCKTEAQRLLGNFKNKGLMRSYYTVPSSPLNPALITLPYHESSPLGPGSTEDGLTNAERWRNSGTADEINRPYTITTGTAPNILRPYTLIMGVMTALDAIYNNYPLVCAAGLDASSMGAPLNTIFPAPLGIEDGGISNTGLRNPDAHLRITMFNTITGNTTSGTCGGAHDHVGIQTDPNSLTSIPPGLGAHNHPNPSPAANQRARVGQIHSGLQLNRGFEVTIRISYQDRNGDNSSCSVSERFQYPTTLPDSRALGLEDIDATATPLDASAVDDTDRPEQVNTALPSAGPMDFNFMSSGSQPMRPCTDPVDTGSVNIRISNTRPGSVFMCRNLTQMRPLNRPTVSNILTTVFPNTRRLRILSPSGVRQSFFSSELNQINVASNNAPGGTNIPPSSDTDGDMFYNSLYYPYGDYFCNTTDGCAALPRVATGAHFNDTNTGYYSVYHPSNHNSNVLGAGKHWQPCEYTQISCVTGANPYGAATLISPSVARVVPGVGNSTDGYHLQYQNLQPGCEVHLQIAEVDSSYNVRAIEVKEYIHEKIPGNRLVFNHSNPLNGRILSKPTGWNFYCHTGAPNPFAAVPRCTGTADRTATTPARFNLNSTCYIDYPGTPDIQLAPNRSQNGVWHSDPRASEAYDN